MGADIVAEGVMVFLTPGVAVATTLALLAGTIVKTWFAYLKAKAKDPTLAFDYDYALTAVTSVLAGSQAIAMLAPMPPASPMGWVSYIAFCFGAGLGLNHAANEKIDKVWEEGKSAPK